MGRPLGLLAVLGVLLLGGCALQPGGQTQATYVLNSVGDVKPVARPGHAVLVVMPPQAEPGFDTAGIVYTRTPLRLDYYNQSRWADTPARMLATLLVATLDKTRAFRAVVTLPSSVTADYQLDVVLLQLQQEFFHHPSEVRLALRVSLIRSATNRVMASRRFQDVEAAPSDDAYGGVQAANKALARLLGEIARFVVQQVRTGP